MYVCSNKLSGYRRRCMFVAINCVVIGEDVCCILQPSSVIKMGPISRPPIFSVQKQLVSLYLCSAISVHLYILSIPTIEVSPI